MISAPWKYGTIIHPEKIYLQIAGNLIICMWGLNVRAVLQRLMCFHVHDTFLYLYEFDEVLKEVFTKSLNFIDGIDDKLLMYHKGKFEICARRR